MLALRDSPISAKLLDPTITLVPSPRVARRLRESGINSLRHQILTLDEFASEILRVQRPELRPLTIDLERVTLQETIEELHRKKKLGPFSSVAESRGFFRSALGSIIECREAGITFETLSNLSQRGKLRAVSAIYAEFQRRVGEQHRISRPERLRLAASLWEAGERRPFDEPERIEASGFVDLSPAEQSLLDAIQPRLVGTSIPSLRPTGLAHLADSLFISTAIPFTAQVEGIEIIEAPGELGEARLIARKISGLIRDGISPESILVTTPKLESSVDLFAEIFSEYDIPTSLEGETPIQREPRVLMLLRSISLAESDFPFAGITALLRNRMFAPNWLECRDDPDLPRKCEGLLRMLGEARGKTAYLNAVRIWAESPPEGLEDEQAEEKHRLNKIFLARYCREFLRLFFAMWDILPERATPREWIRHLRKFAAELGLFAVAESPGWQLWWELLDRWATRPRTGSRESKLPRTGFLRFLHILGHSHVLPRSEKHRNGVRILPVEAVREEACRVLFIAGMGEGSFPRLSAPDSLLEETDRQSLAENGYPVDLRERRIIREQSLFRGLLATPTDQLFLSYPAVDEKGQALLPSSFLNAVRNCFTPGSIPTTHQRMLIEGYTTRTPYCEAEYRVQLAIRMREAPSDDLRWKRAGLSTSLVDHLLAVQRLAQDRFEKRSFSASDGWMDHPRVRQELRLKFPAEKAFSATALEHFIYCPFRFFFEHVLRYEALDEPGEEIEQTRRGAAVHRALSRFHAEIREKIDPALFAKSVPEEVDAELVAALDLAIEEYVERSSGAASKMLWQLEGKRLKRQMSRYRQQWDKFLEPWREKKLIPQPLRLEEGFGLPDSPGILPLTLSVGGEEVRIGGRIDRVDGIDTEGNHGFWIIDYKTGRGANYTGSDLKRLEKLQLPLYALAVERIFYPAGNARPLGLAYWLVTEEGPKIVLPDGRGKTLDWFESPAKWLSFRDQLEKWVIEVVQEIRQGHFPLAPRKRECTDQCNYSHVCRINQSRSVGKTGGLELPLILSTGGG